MKITALLVLRCDPAGSDPVILANATDVSHFGYFQRSSVKEFIVFVGRTVASRTPPGQRQSVQHEEYKVHSYNRNGLCALGFMDDHYPVRSAFSLLNQLIDEYQKNFGESWRSVQADNTQPWLYLNEALTKFQDPAEADKLLKIQRELDETKIILVLFLASTNVYEIVDAWLYRTRKKNLIVNMTISAILHGNNVIHELLKFPVWLEIGRSVDLCFLEMDLEFNKLSREQLNHHSEKFPNSEVGHRAHKTIDSVLARGEKLDSLVEKSSDLSAASQMFYKQAKKTNQCCTIL